MVPNPKYNREKMKLKNNVCDYRFRCLQNQRKQINKTHKKPNMDRLSTKSFSHSEKQINEDLIICKSIQLQA